MIASRLRHLVSIGVVAAVAAGCASAPSKFYTISAAAKPDGSPPQRYAVIVGPVTVPPAVDRPEFVVEVAPNRVDIDEFNRWAAPVSDGIARAVAGDLATLLGTPDVAVAPFANFDPQYRVTISVLRFDTIKDQSTFLDAIWAVQPVNGQTRSGRTTARETVEGKDFAALAAAHSRAVASLSADIAAGIRAAGGATR